MYPPNNKSSAEFRSKAEARLQQHSSNGEKQPIADLLRLQHELQVHQVELRARGEQVRSSQSFYRRTPNPRLRR